MTKLLASVLVLAAAHSAHAKNPLWDAADTVSFSGLAFADEACQKRFGGTGKVNGADRDALADCFTGMHLEAFGKNEWITRDSPHQLIEAQATDGKVTAVGPAEAVKDERSSPTIYEGIDIHPFTPSKSLADKLEKQHMSLGQSQLKICADMSGVVTTVRTITTSGSSDFDKELIAWIKKQTLKPIAVGGGKSVGVCSLSLRTDSGQDGVEGGEVGGVAGDGSSPPPPPPPPPPQNVPPKSLEALRTGGTAAIEPDPATKQDIARSGKSKIVGSFKLCLNPQGDVTSVSQLKSTGFNAYDTTIMTTIRKTWTYKPYELNGHAIAVCTAVTFIYSP